MSKLDTPKKPVVEDWHPADIVAAVWKRGYSMGRLALEAGYERKSLNVALRHPWPAAEKIIAEFLGVAPQAIWPSRYGPDGKSNRKRGGHHPSRDVSTGSNRDVIRRQRAA